MFFRGMVGFVVCLGLVASASAATLPPTIEIGSHVLAGDSTTQVVEIFATGAEDVSGLQIYAQIGDGVVGSGLEPVFASISFGGGLWDGPARTEVGGPIAGTGMLADAGVTFNGASDEVALDDTSRLVATLTIDTTGFSSGTFDLMFKTTDIGADSYFLDPNGDPVSIEITNGSITITPEPATLSLLALGGLALIRKRRRA